MSEGKYHATSPLIQLVHSTVGHNLASTHPPTAQSSFFGAYAPIEPFDPCRAPFCGGALGPLVGVPGPAGEGGKWAYSPAVLGGDCAATAAGTYGDGTGDPLPVYGEPAVAAVGGVGEGKVGEVSPRP